VDFGLFVELVPGVEGLLHKSKLNGKNPEDFNEGDKIKVKVLSQSGFKIELALVEE
jgi:polyribonucleotide nucleotidyltransferase